MVSFDTCKECVRNQLNASQFSSKNDLTKLPSLGMVASARKRRRKIVTWILAIAVTMVTSVLPWTRQTMVEAWQTPRGIARPLLHPNCRMKPRRKTFHFDPKPEIALKSLWRRRRGAMVVMHEKTNDESTMQKNDHDIKLYGHLRTIANTWLQLFGDATSKPIHNVESDTDADRANLADMLMITDQLFTCKSDHNDGTPYWRDMVSFTWNIITLSGIETIADALRRVSASSDWQLDDGIDDKGNDTLSSRHKRIVYTSASSYHPESNDNIIRHYVEFWATFATTAGRGRAHVRQHH